MIYGKLANKIAEEQNTNILNEVVVYKGNGISIAPYCMHNRNYDKDAYFKVFDNENYEKAKKIARIKLYDTKYAAKHEKGNEGKKLWVLNDDERKLLNDILKANANNGSYKNKNINVYDALVKEFEDNDRVFNKTNVPDEIPDYDKGLKGEKYES